MCLSDVLLSHTFVLLSFQFGFTSNIEKIRLIFISFLQIIWIYFNFFPSFVQIHQRIHCSFVSLKIVGNSINLILCLSMKFTHVIKFTIGEYLQLDLLVRHMPSRHSSNWFLCRAVGALNQRFPHWKNAYAFMTMGNIISMNIYHIMERSMYCTYIYRYIYGS